MFIAYLGKFILKPDIDFGREPGAWTVQFTWGQRHNCWEIEVFFIKPAILRFEEYKRNNLKYLPRSNRISSALDEKAGNWLHLKE